ncbi:MAG: glycosyltransferase family 2 protein [Oscillospiraceae bacterium]|nr:glycosyltransferase family 2 protein [Oscillospiraceae bacterium]
MLSVVIPAYYEQEMVPVAAKEMGRILTEAQIEYELIFVDDGSKDATWEKITAAAQEDPHVRGVRFSRNFGKEAAIFAGLQESKGDCVACIDCDLQHPPEKLVEMYHLWEQGYEVIEGVKSDRGKESAFHLAFTKLFYNIISRATKVDMTRASDFKLLDRKAVNVILTMREKRAFFRALSSWVGFRTMEVSYEVQERAAGESKWSTWSLMKYAVSNITSFTAMPLHLVTIFGVITLIVSVIMGAVSLIQKFMGVALGGFTTVIILLLFIGSLIMLSLGIIGYYVGNIYEEIKDRPRYIVAEYAGKERA